MEVARNLDAYDESFCEYVIGKTVGMDDLEERMALKSLVEVSTLNSSSSSLVVVIRTFFLERVFLAHAVSRFPVLSYDTPGAACAGLPLLHASRGTDAQPFEGGRARAVARGRSREVWRLKTLPPHLASARASLGRTGASRDITHLA